MPWCPNCRTEYQEGIEVCSDCGAALVDELPEERDTSVVAYITEEELAQKLADYLIYSKIDAEIEYTGDVQGYAVKVDSDRLEEAKTAFRAFYSVETKNELLKEAEELKEKLAAADMEDIDPDLLEEIPEDQMSSEEKEVIAQQIAAEKVYKPAEVYVKKADESKEMFSTAITFLAFAVLLFVFLLLNAMNIITIFNNPLSLALIGAMGIGCCLVGINAIKRSRRAEIASVEEEKLTASLEGWLEENITEEVLSVIDDTDLSDEILYLRRTELIRTKLFEAYPDLDEGYADDLIENFYNSHFESDAEGESDE